MYVGMGWNKGMNMKKIEGDKFFWATLKGEFDEI